MTQHEYVFVAVSIILGLALTRLLHNVAMLIRAHRRVIFHWSTALWGLSTMAYSLQLWWVGWGLRDLESWRFFDFLVLIFGSICIYGAAELAMPGTEEERIDFLNHSQHLGKLSALAMLVYFLVGPYVNLAMYDNPLAPALAVPSIGVLITGLIIYEPSWFKPLSVIFAVYSALVLYLTA
ncbi:MAG: hypothetical protein AAGI11_14685 [Pseudomonadota bacterium]